jgi:probable F420-dependent oxidoreductase
MASQAESMGLEGVFAAQVNSVPFLPLATAAAVTESLKLATGIAIAAARSPYETAMAAIDLDRLSDGRFILGLGASVRSWTTGIFGAPPYKPLSHLRETVAAVRHIIGGAHKGLAPFEGEYYRADFAELQPAAPPVREEIPIWLAALRGPAVELAAEVAEGIMGHPIWSLDWAVEGIAPHVRRGLERSGRSRQDVELNLWLWCAPDADEASAIEDARPTVAFYGGIAQYESFFAAHGFRDEARRLQELVKGRDISSPGDLVPDEMVRAFIVCGKPDAVCQKVERVWSVADSLVLIPPAYAVPAEKQLHYLAQIAELFYG